MDINWNSLTNTYLELFVRKIQIIIFHSIKIFSIGILLCFSVNAQNIEFGLTLGSGLYKMSDLKAIQVNNTEEFLNDRLKKTSSFPPFFNFGFVARTNSFSNGYVNFLFRYESTGARNSYSDYSGSYIYDIIAEQYIIGMGYRFILTNNLTKQSHPFIELNAGMGLSRVSFKEELILENNSSSETLKTEENSFFFEPKLGYLFSLGKVNISPSLNFYLTPINKGLHLEGEPNAKLQYENGDVNSGWTGLRFQIEFTIDI